MLFEQASLLLEDGAASREGLQLRTSLRARRVSLRVHRDGRVEVVAPPRVSRARIERFVAEHSRWIAERQADARRRAPPPEPFPPSDISLLALGEHWRVHLAGGAGRLRVRTMTDRVLSISGNGSPEALAAAMKRWLVAHVHGRLETRLREMSPPRGRALRRLSLRCQRSRWGSCSARGTISLNLAVLFQSPEVADYLFIHELTHLEFPNHSARFWAAVEARCPNWRALDRQLTEGWRRVPAWLFR